MDNRVLNSFRRRPRSGNEKVARRGTSGTLSDWILALKARQNDERLTIFDRFPAWFFHALRVSSALGSGLSAFQTFHVWLPSGRRFAALRMTRTLRSIQSHL
jgi:hypothetical protein